MNYGAARQKRQNNGICFEIFEVKCKTSNKDTFQSDALNRKINLERNFNSSTLHLHKIKPAEAFVFFLVFVMFCCCKSRIMALTCCLFYYNCIFTQKKRDVYLFELQLQSVDKNGVGKRLPRCTFII